MREQDAQTCERIRASLSAYADGELNTSETARVQKHLCGCPSCTRELEQLRTVSALLADVSAEIMPPECLRASVVQAVHEQAPRRTRRAVVPMWRTIGAVAAAFVLFVGVTVMLATSDVFGGVTMENDMVTSGDAAPMEPGIFDAAEDLFADMEHSKAEGSDLQPPAEEAPTPAPEIADQTTADGSTETVYVLYPADLSGADVSNGVDGRWEGDGLSLTFTAASERVEVCLGSDRTRIGRYSLSDGQLIIVLEDETTLTFDFKAEGGALWLTRK